MERSLARREAELTALLRRLETADEEVAAFVSARGVSAQQVAEELDSGTNLIEYHVREGETVVFVVNRTGVRVLRLAAGADEIAAIHAEMRFQWDRFLIGEEFVARHRAGILAASERLFRRLHDLLWAPIAELPGGPGPATRLVIVPSGPLHDFPFAAFRSASGYLIDDYEIVMAPSAATWRLARRRRRKREARFCAGSGSAARSVLPGDGLPLVIGPDAADLPHVAEECSRVEKALGTARALTGPRATLEAFRKHAPNAPLIHLATHGVLGRDDPFTSALRLADAPLNLHELHDLELAARLVVLSGCQTGLSRMDAGEEMLGLTRGFLQAGADALIVSLWPVADRSTAALMSLLYERMLESREKPAAALREAMRAHRESHPHPYHWAPFVLTGGE